MATPTLMKVSGPKVCLFALMALLAVLPVGSAPQAGAQELSPPPGSDGPPPPLGPSDFGYGHGRHHDDLYLMMNDAAKLNCCNDHDCRETRMCAAGGVLIDGQCCPISPHTKLVTIPLPNGEPHICAPKAAEGGCPFIRCAALPAQI